MKSHPPTQRQSYIGPLVWRVNKVGGTYWMFHKSKNVQTYLAEWGHRIRIHFLPAYSPETNPIERVWWHLHETITRNHRCKTLKELATLACDWLACNNNHYADMRNTFALAA